MVILQQDFEKADERRKKRNPLDLIKIGIKTSKSWSMYVTILP